MSIDNLKSLLDGFEPASLIPDLNAVVEWVADAMGILILIGPGLLLVMGLLYLLAAPKEANYYLGYRCYYGMGSVEAWRFTQRLAGIAWGVLGLAMLIVMLVIRGSYAELTASEVIGSAAKAVLWQAGVALVSVLFINTVVAFNFTSAGEYRRKKEPVSE